MFNLTELFDSISISTGFNNVLDNPIYTAIFIVIILLIILYFGIRDHWDDDDDGFWPQFVKIGIYMCVAVMGIMYLHNRANLGLMRGKYENVEATEIHEGTTGISADNATVEPNITEGAGAVGGLKPSMIVYGSAPAGMTLSQPAIATSGPIVGAMQPAYTTTQPIYAAAPAATPVQQFMTS